MHRLRRVVAILANLLMLQLTLASGAAACPMASRAADVAAPASAREHASHHASHHHTGADCRLPCAPSGCASGAQCAVLLAADAARPAVTNATHTRVAAANERLRSVSTAPEPPPPRA